MTLRNETNQNQKWLLTIICNLQTLLPKIMMHAVD